RSAARGGSRRRGDDVSGISGEAAPDDVGGQVMRRAALVLAAALAAAPLLAQEQFIDVNRGVQVVRGDGEIKTVHISGGVYLLVGGGANVLVQIGNEGVLVVDTGAANMTDKILAAVRELSKKEIRWIVNTTLDTDHVGGNEKISAAGRTVNG